MNQNIISPLFSNSLKIEAISILNLCLPGKLYEKDLNVNELKVDFLTIVGHKFYGPRIGNF